MGNTSARKVNWLIWGIIVAGILTSIAGSAYFLSNSRASGNLSGVWIARMQQPGQKPYNLRMRLQVEGERVTGSVIFPEGESEIEDGALKAERLRFSARRVGVEVHFLGLRKGREVELTATAPDSLMARGTARKTD